jgi:hypothetical protein
MESYRFLPAHYDPLGDNVPEAAAYMHMTIPAVVRHLRSGLLKVVTVSGQRVIVLDREWTDEDDEDQRGDKVIEHTLR